MKDLYDNEVTTKSEKTIDAINRFTTSLIGYGTDFGVIFEASDEDPDCAVAATLGGILGMFMETPDRLEIADTYFNRALTAAPAATEREQLLVEAMWSSRQGDLEKALGCFRKLAKFYPRDLLSAKMGQTHYFNLGDDEGMLWLADQVIDAHKDTAFAHGMRAFGLEQMSQLGEAEEEARLATDMQRAEPWAHHAVAHVMVTQGRHAEGIQWMRDLSGEWDYCNSFMYTHNWWHLALFHLEREEFDEALRLYDEHIWGRDKTYSQDQINAISLLWRLEMAGADVGDRWQDVASHVADRSLVLDQPFLDMQYVYALARGGKTLELNNLLSGMELMEMDAPKMTRAVWEEVAAPASRAFVAFADEDYAKAEELLAPARARMQSIGGSHAQRDLFEQVWLHSLIRQNKMKEALELLNARVAFRDPPALDVHLHQKVKAAAV